MQKFLFLFLACHFFSHHSLAKLTEPTIASVYTEYRSAQTFESLQEFFTGEENQRAFLILRSQQNEREGLYFSITLDEPLNHYQQAQSLKISYQKNTQPKPCEHSFTLERPLPCNKKLLIGLTGTDWSPSTRLNAWKIELLSAEGHVLSQAQSYAWSMPK